MRTVPRQTSGSAVVHKTQKPAASALVEIARSQPELLNALVAYFVFEWRAFRQDQRHGEDQNGVVRRVPNYLRMWGLEDCIYYLFKSPQERAPDDPGFITEWLKSNA